MNISLILRAIRDAIGVNNFVISDEVKANIKKIKEICNSTYSNQSFYGAASLNRMILLNSEITALLTPETIIAIFSIHNKTTRLDSSSPIAIDRNSTGLSSLAAVLYYGFIDGTNTIKHMPNNEHNYSRTHYQQQKIKFTENTLPLIENIKKAANSLGIDLTRVEFNSTTSSGTPTATFNEICARIDEIKANGKSAELLRVPGYSAHDIRTQCISGFHTVCRLLNINTTTSSSREIIIGDPHTLDSIVTEFLGSEQTLLNGTVTHLFYDRVHLEACLEQNQVIIIAGTRYTFKDIFKAMITKCDSSSDHEYVTAKEQLETRLHLVKNHLKSEFPIATGDHLKPEYHFNFGFYAIKNLINTLNHEIDKLKWGCKARDNIASQKSILNRIINIYKEMNGKVPLQNCMNLARTENPEKFDGMMKAIGDQIILNTSELPNDLLQGPRNKSQATKDLETIAKALCNSDKKNTKFSFNALDELEVTINGKIFNLTSILKNNPDFEQIQLVDADFTGYLAFYSQHFGVISSEHFAITDSNNSCANMHHAEKVAIRTYTGDLYPSIQSFLRNHAKIKQEVETHTESHWNSITNLLLTTVIAAHGLAKPKTTNECSLRTSNRREIAHTNEAFVRARLDSYESNKPTREAGFTSSTAGTAYNSFHGNIKIIYSEQYNLFGKDVSALSHYPSEREVLYAPGTEFVYTHACNKNHMTTFNAKPVRTITEHGENTYTPILRIWHELKILENELNTHLADNKHNFFKRIFDTVDNKSKLSCIKLVKYCLRYNTHHIKPEALTREALLEIKDSIAAAIEKNEKLVANAKHKASLGNTDKTLKQALNRINTAIELMDDHIKQAFTNNPDNRAEFDKRYGLVKV